MVVGHIFGIPFEETALQFAPVGVATMTVIAVAGRTKLGWLRRRVGRRSRTRNH